MVRSQNSTELCRTVSGIATGLALWTVLLTCAAASPAPTRPAARPAGGFQTLFGEQLRRVRATGDRKDDIALAGQFIETAGKRDTGPELRAELCRTAYALTHKLTAAQSLAVKAMTLLAARQPDLAGECQEKIVSVRQRRYLASRGTLKVAAGDTLIDALLARAELHTFSSDATGALAAARRAAAVARAVRSPLRPTIDRHVKRTLARERALAAVLRAKGLLKTDPNDRKTRRDLLATLVADLDRPAEAAGYLADTSDERWRTYVPLAARAVQTLAGPVCREMGAWYHGLAAKADPALRGAVLHRARAYYLRCVRMHEPGSPARAAASRALVDIAAELDKLARSPGGVGPVDLLALTDTSRHTLSGRAMRVGRAVRCLGDQGAWLALAAIPADGYRLELRFRRMAGQGPVGVILPIAGRHVRLVLGEGPAGLAGLSRLDDAPPGPKNETTLSAIHLSPKRDTTVTVRVLSTAGQVQILVRIDGIERIRWRGSPRRLSVALSWRPSAPHLGLTSAAGTVEYKSAHLLPLSGPLKLLTTQPPPTYPPRRIRRR